MALPRRRILAIALPLAVGGLLLGACAGGHVGPSSAPAAGPMGAVDHLEHAQSPAATLPLRGARSRPGGLPPAPTGGSFDRPADPPAAPGFEVGRLPNRLVVPGGSPPVRLSVPAIGVETPLTRLGLEPDGSMEVPGDFGLAGWFAEGPVPGQPGPAVIAGHVDSRTGPAVFYRLRDLRAGDHIDVTRADGTRLRFVVDTTRSFPKARFPTDAVFGPTPAAELRLVTCAGTFDRARGSYRDNLVVFARLVGIVRPNQG